MKRDASAVLRVTKSERYSEYLS